HAALLGAALYRIPARTSQDAEPEDPEISPARRLGQRRIPRSRRACRIGKRPGEKPMTTAEHGWWEPGLHCEKLGAVARLTLDRPQAMNSFSPGLVRALNEAMAAIAADADIRVLIL